MESLTVLHIRAFPDTTLFVLVSIIARERKRIRAFIILAFYIIPTKSLISNHVVALADTFVGDETLLHFKTHTSPLGHSIARHLHIPFEIEAGARKNSELLSRARSFIHYLV